MTTRLESRVKRATRKLVSGVKAALASGRGPACAAALAVLAASLWLAATLQDIERSQLERHIEQAVTRISSDVAAALTDGLAALDRFARRWELRGGFSAEEWRAESALYLRDMEGLVTLAWVDESLTPVRVAPERESVLDVHRRAFREPLQIAVQRAREAGRSSLAPPLLLPTGKWVLVAASLSSPRQGPPGSVIAVLDLKR
ncbi:MAG: hypothetical protein ACP5U2_00135, partial [Bryobacteraceae bacterium]